MSVYGHDAVTEKRNREQEMKYKRHLSGNLLMCIASKYIQIYYTYI